MTSRLDDDLVLRTLDPRDDEGEAGRLLRGWGEALARGFHQGRHEEEQRRAWQRYAVADRMSLRGVWPRRTTVASPAMPVATYSTMPGRLHVGGGAVLPLHMITDVTVAPTHRRRGLLRRLMTEDLADAAARGLPLAALTVTEGGIYGRFGFGVATRLRSVEVEVGPRFALRELADDGGLEMVEPAEAWPTVDALHERDVTRTRGSVRRPAFYEMRLSGVFDFRAGKPDTTLRGVLHLDAAGQPDGYALWRHAGEVDGRRTLDVEDLLALSPAAHRRLWRFLADVDLTDRVRWRDAPVVDALDQAVVDPRVVSTLGLYDGLWLRVLDVPAALRARPWGDDGVVVVEVDDPLGHAAGRWRVEVRDGRAEVVAAGEAAGEATAVRLDASALASLYLGDVAVATLHAAGRLDGSPEAVARLAALADVGPAPHCATHF